MSYLLWQIFACLLGTAILFLALGWLLRGWFWRSRPDNLITDSERASWQTSLEGLRNRIEAETSRKLAAEKALEDAKGQTSKISLLLDQHTIEIRKLSQELTDKSRALTESDANFNLASQEQERLKGQVADLTAKLSTAVSAGNEVTTLRSRVADLEPKLQAVKLENTNLKDQISDLSTKLLAIQGNGADPGEDSKSLKADAELDKLRLQLSDLQPKLQAATEENGKLKNQVAELTPKLAMAAAAGAEVVALKAQIATLEPQVSKLQITDIEGGELRARLADLTPKLAAATAAMAETTTLKAHIAELEGKLAKAKLTGGETASDNQKLCLTVAEKDAELSKCRSRVAELDGELSKQHSKPAPVAQQATATVERDDLKKIYGIGPVLEKRLNGLGVYFFREIAMWTKDDILRYEEHLKEFPDRIERDHWVDGAREQHLKKYGEQLEQSKSAGV